MFSYYGSKSKIVDYYPAPKYSKIIEPFAGSARYSLKYWQNDVLLVDKYEIVIRVWKYLQQASEQDIKNLPEPKYKQSINDFNISNDERLLLGFMVARGISSPQRIVQKFSDISLSKKNIIENLHKIKHWEIKLGSYDELDNKEATWFIDPPYQFGGEHYKKSSKQIDFNFLAEWCKNRNGQSIVCENTKANWLPFKRIIEFNGAYTKTTEAIWSNHKTNYDLQQQSLF
jgi:hypothetical protein